MPRKRIHESSFCMDQNVLTSWGVFGPINIRGYEEFLGKFHQNIGAKLDPNIHAIHMDLCLHGSDQRIARLQSG